MLARVAFTSLALMLAALPGVRRTATPSPPPSVSAPVVRGRVVPAPTRALSGRVEGADHVPLAGAAVQAILVHEGRTWPMARAATDADGRFTLRDLPEGSYWVVATAPDHARVIAVVRAHGRDPDPVTLTCAEGARIEGAVMARAQDDPHALQGAIVRAWREGAAAGDDLPWVARADARGRFALEGLARGSYRVEVAEAGYESLRRIGVPAPTASLTLTVRALAALEGVVRTAHGDGARGATVLLAGSGVWPPRTIPVLDDGRFLIEALPSGVYELRASRDDDVAEPVAPLVLEPGDHRDVTLSLGAGASLVATVVDAVTQRPLANARVVVAEDAISVAPRALVSDAAGRIRVPGLLRRAHQVSLRATGYAPRTGVSVNPQDGPVTLALDRAAVVVGRVVDGRGHPVANTQVELTVRDQDGAVSWMSGATVAFREALFGAQVRGPRPLIPAGELGVMPGRVPLIPEIGRAHV